MRFPFFHHLSIRFKFFFLFLGVLLFSFFAYTMILMHQSSDEMRKLGSHSASQVLLQTGQFVESKCEIIKRSLDYITVNEVLRLIVSKDTSAYIDNLVQWNIDANQLRNIIFTFSENNPDIKKYIIYTKTGLGDLPAAEQSQEFKSVSGIVSTRWYNRMMTQEKAFWWFPQSRGFPDSDNATVHAVRKIPDYINLDNTVGYVRADIPGALIDDILNKAEFSPSSFVFIINSYSEIIATSNHSKKRSQNELIDISHLILKPDNNREVWQRVSYNGIEYYLGLLKIEQSDWQLYLAIPSKDMEAFGDNSRNQMIIVLLLMIPLLFPLSFAVAAATTRRIDLLLQGVRKIKNGALNVVLPVNGNDEIDELTDNFNQMVERIQGLVHEQYHLGQSVKDLELKALQAQINPHFLYNTLDLINILAKKEDVAKVKIAVEALTKFYRLSLSAGADEVALIQEVDHVKTYTSIQNMRFEHSITLIVDIPEDIKDCRVLKLVLQPLVENSILHGIREKENEAGIISITAWKEISNEGFEYLVICVRDDGVGIPQLKLDELNSGLGAELSRNKDTHGYGLKNIDQRLKIRYGNSFGLSFKSELGKGTEVRVLIPIMK